MSSASPNNEMGRLGNLNLQSTPSSYGPASVGNNSLPIRDVALGDYQNVPSSPSVPIIDRMVQLGKKNSPSKMEPVNEADETKSNESVVNDIDM